MIKKKGKKGQTMINKNMWVFLGFFLVVLFYFLGDVVRLMVFTDTFKNRQYFSNILAVSFIDGGNRSTRRKQLGASH